MVASLINCSIDIFSFEGGNYQILGAQLLSCVTNKRLNDSGGTFSIVLAPGGPTGVNAPPYWSQIITPMSLVVITMKRGERSAVVMVGVVTTAVEAVSWNTGGSVQRGISFSGMDYGYFFSMKDWYSLFYIAHFGAGANLGALTGGLSQGSPHDIGALWFSKVMLTTLQRSYVPFNSAQVPFKTAVGTLFEAYPVKVPSAYYFVDGSDNWIGKFRNIFISPYYEVFVTTAPDGGYGAASGYQFFTQEQRSITGGPVLVARVNPIPNLTSSLEGNLVTFTGVDVSRWIKLPVNTLDEGALLQSTVSFDEQQVTNFYTLNPTFAFNTQGGDNSSIVPSIANFAAVADQASIARYGFRPANASFYWFADPTTNQGANGGDSAQKSLLALAGRLLGVFCGVYHPTPLMARASVSMPLRPDIMIGTRFSYTPWKSGETWDFYIDSVQHQFTFGGQSRTTLMLSRGLPSAVYNNPALLLNVYLGNAQRIDAVYTSGLPSGAAPYLQAFTLNAINELFNNQIYPLYTKPQATQNPTPAPP